MLILTYSKVLSSILFFLTNFMRLSMPISCSITFKINFKLSSYYICWNCPSPLIVKVPGYPSSICAFFPWFKIENFNLKFEFQILHGNNYLNFFKIQNSKDFLNF